MSKNGLIADNLPCQFFSEQIQYKNNSKKADFILLILGGQSIQGNSDRAKSFREKRFYSSTFIRGHTQTHPFSIII